MLPTDDVTVVVDTSSFDRQRHKHYHHFDTNNNNPTMDYFFINSDDI
ncbi:unnamed protein product, partial [Adineta steineri]